MGHIFQQQKCLSKVQLCNLSLIFPLSRSASVERCALWQQRQQRWRRHRQDFSQMLGGNIGRDVLVLTSIISIHIYSFLVPSRTSVWRCLMLFIAVAINPKIIQNWTIYMYIIDIV